MGFLKKLFTKKEDDVPSVAGEEVKPSDREIFSSPSLLADWTMKNIVNLFSVEDDFDRAPDEKARENLNITYEQIERLAREEGLLRAVGVGFCVKQYCEDTFYLKFFSALYGPVATHMYSSPTPEQINDTRDALEFYINALMNQEDENLKEFQLKYLHRVYDDNDHFYKLLLGGIGTLAVSACMNVYEPFRDVYFKATQGMSFESAKLILETMNKIKNEENDA